MERVADALVVRWFCRVSLRRVPDKATLLRWAHTLRAETLQVLVDRTARLAKEAKVTRARTLRIESTGVQTPIHHPTDRGRLGEGVRVLTRLIQRAKPLVHQSLAGVRAALRRRVRRARRTLQQVHRVRRQKGEDAAEHQRELDTRLLEITGQTVRQAARVRLAWHRHEQPVAQTGPTVSARWAQRLRAQVAHFLPLVERGMRQAHARVLNGQLLPSAQKGLSLFAPHPQVVKRGKAGAPVECGRQVVFDAVEGGLVSRFHVLADTEAEGHQALPAIQHHRARFDRPPWRVVGDRRRHTKGLEERAQGLGVARGAMPRTGTLTAAQRARARPRRWRRRSRWRAGSAGRIHSVRRDYGLARCRSHGLVGLERDVGWGVFASDRRHLATAQGQRLLPGGWHESGRPAARPS